MKEHNRLACGDNMQIHSSSLEVGVSYFIIFMIMLPLLMASIFGLSCNRTTELKHQDSIVLVHNSDVTTVSMAARMKNIRLTSIDLDSNDLKHYKQVLPTGSPLVYPFNPVVPQRDSIEDNSMLTPIQKVVSDLNNGGMETIAIIELNIRGSNYVFLLDEESPVSVISRSDIEEKKLDVINEFVVLVDDKDSTVNENQYQIESIDMVFILNDKFYVKSIENTKNSIYQLTGKHINGIIGADILNRKQRLSDLK